MIPSPPINQPCQTYSRWLAARRSQARIHALNSQTAALAITPINLQRARSDRPLYSIDSAKISLYPSRPNIISTADVPKSP
jgi:hypothetical protein